MIRAAYKAVGRFTSTSFIAFETLEENFCFIGKGNPVLLHELFTQPRTFKFNPLELAHDVSLICDVCSSLKGVARNVQGCECAIPTVQWLALRSGGRV